MTTTPAASLIDAYLQRLGVDREAPSSTSLAHLHRAHVERVPYETMWLHGTEGWSIEAAESFQRIATSSRGGYCFHLNGAFSTLLTALGYRVTVHSGAVHDVGGPTAMTLGNHACLVVHDLRTASNPGGRWYVDAGLGDALHAPIPLVDGHHLDRVYRFSLTDLGLGRWQFTHDRRGTFAGMRFSEARAELGAFGSRHRYNATSPDSSFAATVTAQRRHVDGTDVVRGCVLSSATADGTVRQVVERRDDWLAMLDEVFGLRLASGPGAMSAEALDRLWTRVRTAHQAWVRHELDGEQFATAV